MRWAGSAGSWVVRSRRFRTEMNRRFDEASMESTRRFDMLGRDTANLRERMARVEERGGISPEPRDQNAA